MTSLRLISASLLLLSFLAVTALAQQLILHGTVRDQAGNPLMGVNILEKGTKNGTVTDAEGKFTLRTISADAIIVCSYVGYKRVEVATQGQTELTMTMHEGLEYAPVTVVGTRNANRTVTETPVAIDVLDIREITLRLAQLDVHQILQYSAPSFNVNRQSGADGADHVDPATLRGLGPDQTLVLINGKRQHQSALINIFGTRGRGNTGTDLNAIPAGAIERIEILRDGASAQYGSDAIAGVINVILRSDVNHLTGSVTTGAHQADLRKDRSYDGEEFTMSGNYGVPLGETGFVNTSVEYSRKGRTNRPADPNLYPSVYRKQFGDAALNNFASFFNLDASIGGTARVYAFGGVNIRSADAYAWTRDPSDSRNVPEVYPLGFDPRILSNISDLTFAVGTRSTIGDWNVDFSNTLGLNRFHYFVDGTLNASLLANSPTSFDAGGFQLLQNTTALNVNRFIPSIFSGLNVAFGVEHRIDNYQIFAGEDASWKNYGVIDSVRNGRVVEVDTLGRPAGSQGFPGFRPSNIVDELRTNLGAYLDVEVDFTKQWMVGGAVRFETYSDFGTTLNAKLATRYELGEALAVRGSVSSGFRAPSLAQIYFNSTFTDVVGGVFIDKLIAKNNSAIARKAGILPLKQETAQNASVGLTAKPLEGVTATVDAYYVKVTDRIVLTGAFGQSDPNIGADMAALNVGGVQFFVNGLDTKTTGLDVVLSYQTEYRDNHIRISFAGNFNDMKLGAIKPGPKLGAQGDTVFFGRREQYFLLASAPPRKMSLSIDHSLGRLHSSLRFVNFGSVSLVNWVDHVDVYESKTTTDLSVGYDLTDNLTIVAGAANLANVYPTKQDVANTETGGLWDAVQMGFSGRFYFTKLNIRF